MHFCFLQMLILIFNPWCLVVLEVIATKSFLEFSFLYNPSNKQTNGCDDGPTCVSLSAGEWIREEGSGPEGPTVLKVTRLRGPWITQERDHAFENPDDNPLGGIMGAAVMTHIHPHRLTKLLHHWTESVQYHLKLHTWSISSLWVTHVGMITIFRCNHKMAMVVLREGGGQCDLDWIVWIYLPQLCNILFLV